MRKQLTIKDINPNILGASYAVRGRLFLRSQEILKEMKEGKKYPFDEITYCNIGNPQRLMQKPLSYARNVLALCTSPDLLNNPLSAQIFKKDEIERAKHIVQSAPGIMGGYTHSQGYGFIRQEVNDFIEKRDGVKGPGADKIWLCGGASQGIQHVLLTLIREKTDCIMTPIPQYPIYTASTALYGGTVQGYNLNENDNWSVNLDELNRSYEEAIKNGLDVKVCVSINPGNPTGQVLDQKTMKDLVTFCAEKGIILFADEVYQKNVYDPNIEWVSFRKIMTELKLENVLQLVSFHSCSKGFFGECGRRGGYMEFSDAFNPEVLGQIYKKTSISLCPNIDGQVMTSILVNPPKEGTETYEIWQKEMTDIFESLKRRAAKISQVFGSGLPNLSCNVSKGAMYAFPNVKIPPKAVEEAKKEGLKPDVFYCIKLLEETGVVTVPGSGFESGDGEKTVFHFRTTILPQEEVFDQVLEKFKKFHVEFIEQYK